ncbi:malate synthase [Shewanella yunxiaonensis]|uniref:Malate synthase n=1 Tax=Shewanella yunxiaonensis TaxID=2829809 RepID=A0ABX7YU21_9GAMM|nr:malate synthase [Shewanella yunxiaonensis]QUN06008.1 malate synthase [Shewanella yunxiaonensis]
MNMPLNTTNLQRQHPCIAMAVVNVESLAKRHISEKLTNAKQLLDILFPLAQGSHNDVTGYMVYYQHLLACFADATLSGLRHPRQFIALSGHKTQPDALLLKHDSGCHLEMSFNHGGLIGCHDQSGLDDLQLEEAHNRGNRWISLLHESIDGHTSPQEMRKQFVDHEGLIYAL